MGYREAKSSCARIHRLLPILFCSSFVQTSWHITIYKSYINQIQYMISDISTDKWHVSWFHVLTLGSSRQNGRSCLTIAGVNVGSQIALDSAPRIRHKKVTGLGHRSHSCWPPATSWITTWGSEAPPCLRPFLCFQELWSPVAVVFFVLMHFIPVVHARALFPGWLPFSWRQGLCAAWFAVPHGARQGELWSERVQRSNCYGRNSRNWVCQAQGKRRTCWKPCARLCLRQKMSWNHWNQKHVLHVLLKGLLKELVLELVLEELRTLSYLELRGSNPVGRPFLWVRMIQIWSDQVIAFSSEHTLVVT